MGNQAKAKVLLVADAARSSHVAPLVTELRGSPLLEVEASTELDRLLDLRGVQAVYADWNAAPLTQAHARALSEFVESGGCVVAVGRTLTTWAAQPTVSGLAGWTPDGLTVSSELVLTPADTAEPSFRVRDRVHLLASVPPGAEPLLLTSWHYTPQVVAYERAAGLGRFVYVGLGEDPAAYAEPGFRRLVGRSLHRVAPPAPRSVFGVGLLGYGALGALHAASIGSVAGLELRAVCDHAASRRDAAATLGVTAYADGADLRGDPSVDVVVVGLPPAAHTDAVLQALDAGKHVVCEKPFALSAADCDCMIERAAANGLSLTVFQNRRWDPDFIALRNVLKSGSVGEPFYIESFVGGFAHPCGYWHSHEPISGGAVFDWGSHYIDWLLQLVPAEIATVRSVAHKRVWHDVTNADHTSVEIGFADGRQALFVHSDVAAALKPKWYVLATGGAVVGEWRDEREHTRGPDGELDETRILPTDLPARIVVLRPDGDGGAHRERLSLPRRDRLAFYRNLAAHLAHGEPLAVPARDARRTVAVMEAAMRSAREHGAVIPLRV